MRIRGIRLEGSGNFILHEYHAIEYRIVWEAINKDLPELKKMIDQILADEFKTNQ